MISLGHRIEQRTQSHVRISIFVGKEIGQRANAGQLMLQIREYDELNDAGQLGDYMYTVE